MGSDLLWLDNLHTFQFATLMRLKGGGYQGAFFVNGINSDCESECSVIVELNAKDKTATVTKDEIGYFTDRPVSYEDAITMVTKGIPNGKG